MPHATFSARSRAQRPLWLSAASRVTAVVLGSTAFLSPLIARPASATTTTAPSVSTSAEGIGATSTYATTSEAERREPTDQMAERRKSTGRVALIGVPGLEWSDLDPSRTPNLWKLTGEAGSASLSTRAVPPPTAASPAPWRAG